MCIPKIYLILKFIKLERKMNSKFLKKI